MMPSMPNITGGAATSGNGDSAFSADARFGGLNYNSGINTYVVIGIALAIGAFLYVQSTAK